MRKACALAVVFAGCAHGVCTDCPSATLTANGATELTLGVGDMITYAWSSERADIASSTVAIQPTADRCGNKDGAWVVDTLMGTSQPSPLLDCQSGFEYTLTFTVVQRATSEAASSIVTIVVR
jgi:hypothetical protein